MGREHYEEYHEREHDSRIESRPAEDEEEGCPDCKWDSVCPGGCRGGVSSDYEFELKEEEK